MTVDRRAMSPPPSGSAPLERLEALCDPGSLQLMRTQVASARMGEQGARRATASSAAPAASAAARSSAYAQDAGFAGGSLGAGARRHDRARARAGRARARARSSASSSPAARACRRALAALAGYGRIFRAQRRAVRARAADLGHHRRLGRRRLLLAGADRLRGHDRDGGDVPHRPRRRARGDGRGRRRRTSSAAPRVHERNGVCHFVADDRASTPRCWRATCSTTCPQTRGEPPRARRRGRRPRPTTRARSCPTTSRSVYDVRDVAARARRRRAPARGRAALGAQHGLRVRAHRRAARSASSPTSRATSAACSTPTRRRRPRASCARATVRPAAGRARRHARASCPARAQEAAGVIRHGAKLAARVRRGDACRA